MDQMHSLRGRARIISTRAIIEIIDLREESRLGGELEEIGSWEATKNARFLRET